MRAKTTIFNKPEYVLMAGAVIVGSILVLAVGNTMPMISSAWLCISIVFTMLLYARGRKGWMDTKAALDEERAARAAGEIDPDQLARTLNSNIDDQVSALRAAKGLSGTDVDMIEKVQQATSNDRLELYLQPIVEVEESAHKFYEAFSRLRDSDGNLLRPSDYLEAVERANRIGFIDNMILLRSVQAVRALQTEGREITVFCNISPATLYDQNFFALFTQYLDGNRDLAKNLVFEFTYPAISLVDPTIGKSLETISDRGFSFSVDHVQRLDMNLNSLKRLNVAFVKIPCALLQSVHDGGEDRKEQFKAFRAEMAESNVQLIVEKIELERQVELLHEYGLIHGQGNYFGNPLPAQSWLQNDNPAILEKAS